jgi:uncharacterized damage-inducible protein DinB
MEIRVPFERLLAHDRWANGRALESVAALAAPPPKALELTGHVLGAEFAWIRRMTEGKDPEDWQSWETADVPMLRRAWKETLPAAWEAFLGDAEKSDPDREFSYVNYLGQEWDAKVQVALLQLMLHSSYHRGQIASLVRAAGGEPAVQDYMRAAREGVLP